MSIIDIYLKLMEDHKMYHAVPNFVFLSASLGWNKRKYYDKYYKDLPDSPVIALAKKNECSARYSTTHATACARQVFEDYWKDPKSLEKRENMYEKHAKQVDNYYSEFTHSKIESSLISDLIASLKKLVDAEWEANVIGWYSLLFEQDDCYNSIKASGSSMTPEKFFHVWEKASIPTMHSFDIRKEQLVFILMDNKLHWETIAEECQYFFDGFHGTYTLQHIQKDLESEFSAITLEERNKIRKNRAQELDTKTLAFQNFVETLSKEEQKLANYIQHVMVKRDQLRDGIGKCYTILYRIGKKILQEADLPLDLITFCTFDELLEGPVALKEKKSEIEDRTGGVTIVLDDKGGTWTEIGTYDKNKRELDRLFMKQEGITVDKNATEIKGHPASKGIVRGKVKIVIDLINDANKLEPGDILVTGMTRPEFVPLMKKAAAIITDEGGITCHAAIVSRELGKPCIIGTKVATKLLEDGQLVEVNADMGVVKKV